MEDCIFCKIVRNEIPSQRIYEDDRYLVFLDISPVNVGHALLIPRQHYADVDSTPPEVLAHLAKIAQKIAPAIVGATGAEAYNITINNGAAAGQMVSHVHLHLIPRFEDDGFHAWHGRKPYGEGEMAATAEKIKEELDRN